MDRQACLCADWSRLIDGLTQDIIANLCRYRELFVIDHESAFAYRDGNADAERFANQLGVEYVAKGNIRRSGDQVRISAQLIEATTGKTMWADHVDRKFDQLFTLEDEIAANARARSARLRIAERAA